MISAIIGLGNPGAEYARTRHNLGFAVIDRLVDRTAATALETGPWCYAYRAALDDREAILIKPATYVNRSGAAVIEVLQRFDVTLAGILVVVDDFNLPLGTLRTRRRGSDGRHNGLASITEAVASENFARLRLGIGPLPEPVAAAREKIPEFVLGRFAPDQETIVADMIDRAASAVILTLKDGLDRAISIYNGNPTPDN